MRSVNSIEKRMALFLSGPLSALDSVRALFDRGRLIVAFAVLLTFVGTIVSHVLTPKFLSSVILVLQEPGGAGAKSFKLGADDFAEKTLFYLRSHAFALELASHLREEADHRELFEQVKAYGACSPGWWRRLLYESMPSAAEIDGEEQCLAVHLEKMLVFQKTGPDNIAVNVKSRSPELSVGVANAAAAFAVLRVVQHSGEDLDHVSRFLEEKIAETNERVAKAQASLEGLLGSKAALESHLAKAAMDRQLPHLKTNERDTEQQLERQQRLLLTLERWKDAPRGQRVRPALTASEALAQLDRLTRDRTGPSGNSRVIPLVHFLLAHPETAPHEKGWLASLAFEVEELQERLQNIRAQIGEMETQIAEGAALDKSKTEAKARVDVENTLQSELTKRLYEAQVQRMTIGNNVRLLRKATTANFASVMRLPLKLILILLLTVGATLVGLFLWEELDPSLRRAEDARAEGIALGGAVPLLRSPEARAFVPEAMEWIRRRALDFGDESTESAPKRGKLITLVGIESKVGTSFLARALGESLGRSGKKVLLLTLDPQAQSRLLYQRDFTLKGDPQLNHGLAVYQHKEIGSFQIIPVAALIEQGEVLGSPARFADFLKGLQKTFDSVIVDNPSLGALGSRAGQLEMADVLFLVARHRRTRRASLRAALDVLSAVKSPLVYLLLNGVQVEPAAWPKIPKRPPRPPVTPVAQMNEASPSEEKAA